MYLAKVKPHAIASWYYLLAEAFRAESTRIWQSEYDELAILAFLKQPASEIVDHVLRDQALIRDLKPRPDRSLAFNLASSVTFVDLIQADSGSKEVTDAKAMLDMQAIINAQQAAMVAASAASVSAAASAGSGGG